MKITAISDTHGRHDQLHLHKYKADVLVHAGDWTRGRDLGLSETYEFLEWLEKQPFEHKILIAGNHEREIEAGPSQFAHLLSSFKGITYLNNKETIIDGVKFYGSPYSNEFCGWAFMGEEVELSKIWAKIPLDTDVLITHGPAYGINDLVKRAFGGDPHVGSKSLTLRKKIVKPKVHISGHIHEAYGVVNGACKNICASVLDDNYRLVNEPITFEV